jgi:O-antigen ligase
MLLLTIMATVLVSRMPGGNLVNYAVTALFVAVVIAITMIERRPFSFFPPFVVLAVWLCYALVPSIMATDIGLALGRALQIIQILILVFVATNVAVWSERVELFALTYMSVALLSYVASLAGFGFGIVDSSLVADANSADRVSGLTQNANAFGTLMVRAQMAALLFVALSNSKYAKYITIPAFLILGVAVIHSGSRTALLGMLVLVAGCGWIFRIWRIRNATKAVAIIALTSVIVGVAFVTLARNDEFQNRVDSYLGNQDIAGRYKNLLLMFSSAGDFSELDSSVENSIFKRAEFARGAIDAAISNPLGLGLDNFRSYFGTYAHSNYLEILATTGFVGLLLFLFVYAHLLIRAHKLGATRDDNRLVIRIYVVCIVALMAMDVSTVTYYSKSFWLFVAIALASTEVYRDKKGVRTGTKF